MKSIILPLLLSGCMLTNSATAQREVNSGTVSNNNYATSSTSTDAGSNAGYNSSNAVNSSYTRTESNTQTQVYMDSYNGSSSYNTHGYERESYGNYGSYYSHNGGYAGKTTSGYVPFVNYVPGNSNNFAPNATNSYATFRADMTGAPRTNHVTGRTHPYYSSMLSKSKSKNHNCDRLQISCNRPPGNFCAQNSTVPYYQAFYYSDVFYDEFLFYNDLYSLSDPAGLQSFDGYLVYDTDTIDGIVTMDEKCVYLEQPINDIKEFGYTAQYADKYLTGIALFKGKRELHFTRLSQKDNDLWRVLHTGNLSIYDNRFSFPAPENVNTSKMRVVFAGQTSYQTIHSKKQLIDCLNKAYGLQLDAKNYTWKALLEYVDNLD